MEKTSLVVQWLRISLSMQWNELNPFSRKIPQAKGQLSLQAAARETITITSPLQSESSPHSLQLEKSCTQQ